MTPSGAPQLPSQLPPRPRDTEIVVAVFRTIFLLIVMFSPQFREPRPTGAALLTAAVIVAALYNLVLFLLHVRGLPFPRSLIIAVDVILISLWVFFCTRDCESFFALYYAVVIVAGLWFGVPGAFLTAVFASALYLVAVLSSAPPAEAISATTVALQITFLILIAGVVSLAARARERERQALATSSAVLQQFRERIRVAQYVDDLVRPKRLPEAPGLDVAHRYRPAAHSFSGDYYDLIPLGGRRWGLCIADLSGQFGQRIGYLATFKTTLRLTARREQSPARLLAEINREVAAATSESAELETFISMSYLVVDLDAALVTSASAGHEPPALFRAAGGEPLSLEQLGIVLGVIPDATYGEMTTPIHNGDTLVLVTDGMTEVTDRRGAFLGREGLLAIAQRYASAPTADDMAEAIFQRVNEYARGGRRRDDTTVLVARITALDPGAAPVSTLG